MSDNPFELLGLSPSASEEEIVRRAGDLRQTAADEEAETAIRQAVQALTGKPEDRLLHSLLAHPGPPLESPALERLAAAFRRLPASEKPATQEAPALDVAELAALLRPLLLEDLAGMPLPLEMPAIEEKPEEVLRQTCEGIWQVLPLEPGA